MLSGACGCRSRMAARLGATLALGLAIAVLPGCALLRNLGIIERPIESPEDAILYIQERIADEMDQLNIPGFAIAIVDDQSILWEGYFGVENLETQSPVTPDTVFRVGSISKVFTAIEVMRLRDEGLVELDAPIERYLPGFAIRRLFDSDEPITVRSLLTHRSGLPRGGTLPLWYWDPGIAVLRELVGSLEDAYAVHPPWTRYKYSNIGYVTLGLLTETLRGGLWPDFMQQSLLQPIGMRSSAFLSDRLPRNRTIATGYWPVDGENLPGGEYDIITMPSGNLHSTMRDLSTFMQFLFGEGQLDGTPFVDSATLREMYEANYATSVDPQNNGLGWFTDETYLGEKIVFHDGTNKGTISYMAMIPGRKLGLVLSATSNAFESIQVLFAFDALDALRQGLYGISRVEPGTDAVELDLQPQDVASLEGTYILNGERLDIASSDGELAATVSGFTLPLSPHSSTRFAMSHRMIPGGSLRIDFLDSGDALVTIGESYAIYTPRYPVSDTLPATWAHWLGAYSVHPRRTSRYSDADVLWTTHIVLDDGLIRSTRDSKVLLPLDELHARIISGPFEDEIMERNPETGVIEWAAFRYAPVAE